jgi:aerobic-type carbon monoxide dehydrogenase small subunit (CoxS/CutS family)
MTGDRTRTIHLTLDGESRTATVEVRTLLSDLLRHELGATGTHVACEHGSCGACTVLVDGVPVRSCLVLAPQVDGADIETVHSLAVDDDGGLGPVATALHEQHGLQCGFCTPGIVVSMTAALRDGVDLDEALDQVLAGHLCRCTGYVNLRAAVRTMFGSPRVDPASDDGRGTAPVVAVHVEGAA